LSFVVPLTIKDPEGALLVSRDVPEEHVEALSSPTGKGPLERIARGIGMKEA